MAEVQSSSAPPPPKTKVKIPLAMNAGEAAKLDAWISKQRRPMSRAEAVCAIIAHALRYER